MKFSRWVAAHSSRRRPQAPDAFRSLCDPSVAADGFRKSSTHPTNYKHRDLSAAMKSNGTIASVARCCC